MNPFARIFDRSQQAAAAFTQDFFHEFRRADRYMEVVFYRIIAVVMLLLAPPLGLIAVLLGMAIGISKAVIILLKHVFTHRRGSSDQGGL